MDLSRVKLWQSSISKLIKADLKNISLARIREATEYALNSGKRLRPMLLLEFSNDPTDIKNKASIELALFVEYVHNASLIIDDMPCMDNDDTRRGQLTLHKKYGESIAQLVSYNLLVTAQNHLRKGLEIASSNQSSSSSSTGIDTESNRLLVSRIGDMVSDVLSVDGLCGGQYLDLTIDSGIDDMPPRKQREEVLRIARMKTGLLFSLSFVLGWATMQFDSTKPEDLAKIKEAGTSFGLAYQIVDDIKDIDTDKTRNDGRCNVCRYYPKNELIDLFTTELNNFVTIMQSYAFPKLFSDLHNYLVIAFRQALTKNS